MRRALAAAAALAALPAMAAAPGGMEDEYTCELLREDGRGTLSLEGTTTLEGRPLQARAIWTPPGLAAMAPSVHWGLTEVLAPPDDEARVLFSYFIARVERRQRLRIELRRNVEGSPQGAAIAAGDFTRRYGRLHLHLRVGALRRYLEGAQSLSAVAVNRDGAVLAEYRLDRATLDGHLAMYADIRSEWAAMVGDPSRHCGRGFIISG